MKTLMTLGLGLFALMIAGCNDTKTVYITAPDIQAPAAPRGVTSTTGDGQVLVGWYPNGESDLAGYRVWRNNVDLDSAYFLIATVSGMNYLDQNVSNATTYYYAVSAFDDVGNESALSPNDAFDTPRPKGSNYMRDFYVDPGAAGFDFFNVSPYGLRTSDTDTDADIYLEYSSGDGAWFINVTYPDIDIQDMGYTDNFDAISWAPEDGWSSAGWVEAIAGHTYVIWTADFHYAKIRITSIDQANSRVYFDWGYQLSTSQDGNRELKPVVGKPQHDPATYLRRTIAR